MGRKALSDAEKKSRGTYRADRSEEARLGRAVGKVLAFPIMSEIPSSGIAFPDRSRGDLVYKEFCSDLMRAGLLTKISQKWIEQFALSEHTIAAYIAQGKLVPVRIMEMRRSALLELKMLNVDQEIVSRQMKSNRFATNGFPTRLGSPEEHKAIRSV